MLSYEVARPAHAQLLLKLISRVVNRISHPSQPSSRRNPQKALLSAVSDMIVASRYRMSSLRRPFVKESASAKKGRHGLLAR